jgi:predicted Zn finger-like uncharacterized protein
VHISCEKCATTYLLDDALIPPQGAPVQCTRCGHVFTARLGASDPTSTQPGPPSWEQGEGPRGGHPPTNQTQVFGAVPSPGASKAGADINQTLLGNPAAAVGFGAPDASGNKTLMFAGAGRTGEPDAQPSTKQTMVFGKAVGAAPQAPSKQAMAFVKAPAAAAPAGDAASRQTLMFGGAPVKGGAAAPASTKQTMVFGASPVSAESPSQPSTKPPAAAGAASTKQTMVFGAPVVGPAAPAAQPSTKQTMVFGAAAVEPDAGGARNQTMLFGKPQGGAPGARAVVISAGAAGEDALPRPESTVRVDLDAMMKGQAASGEEGPALHDRTQRFAMSGGGREGAPASEGGLGHTQRFAMSAPRDAAGMVVDGPPVLTPIPPGESSRSLERTQPSRLDEMPTLDPEGALPPLQPASAPPLAYGAPLGLGGMAAPHGDPMVRVLQEPGVGPQGGPRGPLLIATTLPNMAPVPAPARVELPPEPVFTANVSTEPELASPRAQDDEAVAELRLATSRRTTIAVIIFVVLALVLGLAVLWRLFGRTLSEDPVELEAKASVESAIGQLRLDDGASRQRATEMLQAVLRGNPKSVEAESGLVLALAFAADDARVVAQTRREAVKRGRGSDEVASEAEARAAEAEKALRDAMGALDQLGASAPAGSASALAVLRASAMGWAVLGEPTALGIEEAYRQASTASDDWVDLVLPSYVARGGSALEEALKRLQAVAERPSNSTFFRAPVLRARLLIRSGNLSAAEAVLKTVTTLNARHEVAAALLEQISGAGDTPLSAAGQPGLDR